MPITTYPCPICCGDGGPLPPPVIPCSTCTGSVFNYRGLLTGAVTYYALTGSQVPGLASVTLSTFQIANRPTRDHSLLIFHLMIFQSVEQNHAGWQPPTFSSIPPGLVLVHSSVWPSNIFTGATQRRWVFTFAWYNAPPTSGPFTWTFDISHVFGFTVFVDSTNVGAASIFMTELTGSHGVVPSIIDIVDNTPFVTTTQDFELLFSSPQWSVPSSPFTAMNQFGTNVSLPGSRALGPAPYDFTVYGSYLCNVVTPGKYQATTGLPPSSTPISTASIIRLNMGSPCCPGLSRILHYTITPLDSLCPCFPAVSGLLVCDTSGASATLITSANCFSSDLILLPACLGVKKAAFYICCVVKSDGTCSFSVNTQTGCIRPGATGPGPGGSLIYECSPFFASFTMQLASTCCNRPFDDAKILIEITE